MCKFFSQIVWFGDLNYRITDLDAEVVKRLLDNNAYEKLLEADQLIQQHKAKRIFKHYTEGEITFKPTYKYNTGTDDWDSR